MAHALRKQTRLAIPPRDHDRDVLPRPVDGDHNEQVDIAFALTFQRYEKALEELAKV